MFNEKGMEFYSDYNYTTVPARKKSYDMELSQQILSNRATIKKTGHKHTSSLENPPLDCQSARKTFSLKEIYDFLSEENGGMK